MKEVSFKAWATFEAMRIGRKTHTIFQRFYRGKYPDLKRRRVNSWVVKVLVPDDVAAQMGVNDSPVQTVNPPPGKCLLPPAKTKLCECGRPGVKRVHGSLVCLRCFGIEVHNNGRKKFNPLAKYASLFTFESRGNMVIHR